MGRFSPSYRPRKQFTLHEGVMNAADALRRYTTEKRRRGIEDERLEREEESHERAGKRTDEYLESQEFYRDRSRARDFFDRGIVYGGDEAAPGQQVAPGESGGIPNVRGMPTIEGESVDAGFARPPGPNPDPSMARAPGRNPDPGMAVPSPDDVGGGGNLADMVQQAGARVVGSGVPGDWNGQFLQMDGARPIPGMTGAYVMDESEKERREAAEQQQLADMLARSAERTGFAEDPELEAEIQTRTGQYTKPQVPGEDPTGPTRSQRFNLLRDRATIFYDQLVREGEDPQAALEATEARYGVAPDPSAARRSVDDVRGAYGETVGQYGQPAPGIEDTVAQLLSQGYTPNEIMAIIGRKSQPIGDNPISPMAADTASAYLQGRSLYDPERQGFLPDR